MPKHSEKQVVINEIKEKLGRASSAVLVQSIGLTVEQDTVLRKRLREAGVDFKVYKNTMMNLAVEGTRFDGLKPFFKGTNTLALSFDEPTAAARLISKEMKTAQKLAFKGGVIDGMVYDAKGMTVIADIPPREELLSKLLGSFKSPMSSFARVINQIAEKGGEVVTTAQEAAAAVEEVAAAAKETAAAAEETKTETAAETPAEA